MGKHYSNEAFLTDYGSQDYYDVILPNELAKATERENKFGRYLVSTVVNFPEPAETRVTIGSRATIKQDGDIFDVDIVGVPMLHDPGEQDDVMPCSVESPIARVIIGQEVGYAGLMNVNGTNIEVEVMGIDQQITQATPVTNT